MIFLISDEVYFFENIIQFNAIEPGKQPVGLQASDNIAIITRYFDYTPDF